MGAADGSLMGIGYVEYAVSASRGVPIAHVFRSFPLDISSAETVFPVSRAEAATPLAPGCFAQRLMNS